MNLYTVWHSANMAVFGFLLGLTARDTLYDWGTFTFKLWLCSNIALIIMYPWSKRK